MLQGLYLLATGQTKAGLAVGTTTSAALLLLDIKRAYDVGEWVLCCSLLACHPTVLPWACDSSWHKVPLGTADAQVFCLLPDHAWAISYMPCWQGYRLCSSYLAPH